MGGIKPHRQGIQITFNWEGKQHRPTVRIPATPTNLKYASRLKAEIDRAISLGTFTLEQYIRHFPTSRIANSAPKTTPTKTFSTMAGLWTASISHLSAGTKIKYQQSLNFWLLNLGHLSLDQILYSNIAALTNSQDWSAKHRNNMLIPLRGVLEMAYIDGIIQANPADRIKNAKLQKEPPDPLMVEEVEQVLEHMRKYHPQIYNVFEFAFFTGMRPSEIIALRWGEIDFQMGLVRVKKALTYKVEHETKTFSVRDIELNQRAIAALLRQKQHTFLKGAFVFENPVTNAPYTEERPLRRAYWHPTLKALGLRERNFYQTRHTFATLNLMAGANELWVANQLGHATTAMLRQVYSRWIPGADKQKERGKLDALFSTNTAPKAVNQS